MFVKALCAKCGIVFVLFPISKFFSLPLWPQELWSGQVIRSNELKGLKPSWEWLFSKEGFWFVSYVDTPNLPAHTHTLTHTHTHTHSHNHTYSHTLTHTHTHSHNHTHTITHIHTYSNTHTHTHTHTFTHTHTLTHIHTGETLSSARNV